MNSLYMGYSTAVLLTLIMALITVRSQSVILARDINSEDIKLDLVVEVILDTFNIDICDAELFFSSVDGKE